MARLGDSGALVKEYRSLQYLRGLAALMVVIFHVGQPLARMGYSGGWPTGLAGGVDIFFVISGFVMWVTTRTRQVGTFTFWWKRITRIVPLYWLVTSFMLAVMLAAPSAMQTSVFSLPHVLASYAFIPWQNPGKPEMEPLLFAGWTLNYEMFFYLIFGVLLLVRPALRLAGTVLIFALLVAAGVALGAPRLSIAGFYSSNIILEFGYGMLLGELLFRRGGKRLMPTPLAWMVFAAGLALLVWLPCGDDPLALFHGLPALAIVAAALAIETNAALPRLRLAHVLGDASYSIYLTQLITMGGFAAVWRQAHIALSTGSIIAFSVLDVAVAALAGWLCYRLVERRLNSIFRGKPKAVGNSGDHH